MRTFRNYHNFREENDSSETEANPDVMNDGDSAELLHSTIKIAVKKGFKKQLIGFLKSLNDPEINNALQDVDKGLGDISKDNNNIPDGPDDEVVPHSTDLEEPEG